ncbi:MAG: hypothetical protein EHM80_01860 [Nitrospiraceae bacterium]|nr:MAG: hypothetical protein EHM80_01860 [Nitrospiraceae bacterium]
MSGSAISITPFCNHSVTILPQLLEAPHRIAKPCSIGLRVDQSRLDILWPSKSRTTVMSYPNPNVVTLKRELGRLQQVLFRSAIAAGPPPRPTTTVPSPEHPWRKTFPTPNN